MAKRETYAIRKCTVTQRMQTERFFPLIPAQAGRAGSDKQVFNGGTEHGDAFRRNNITCTRVVTALPNDVEQAGGDFDAVPDGDAADWNCALTVATNADAKRCNAIDRFSAQAHVGGDAVETERAATVDRHRDFGGKSLRK